ncbi:MAG TPA: 2,3-bisphosphoglycerate-independent phosphoglycerate mutase [Desulfuromonadales bacterium]|nr:2,3-bisphosphoglycerate-independent phosphoglycerate mutase [Desulfuromonadales bacterium]
MSRPLALVILDGWGINPSCDNNAVCQAKTPRLDALGQDYPTTQLGASGPAVGLPEGQMGNSEVGHMNLGAGRVVYQDLTRIFKSIEDGTLETNPVLVEALEKIKKRGGKLHLMGLLSDGGVHSHNTHLYALLKMASKSGLDDICVHCFMDGRDTPPKSGARYLRELEEELECLGTGRIATVTGRYYAMDRDNRWDRVERAWRAMVHGEGETADDSEEAIQGAYEAGQNDEFVQPRVILSDGEPSGLVEDDDGIIFFNFRSDRAREITRAFTQEDFNKFERPGNPDLASYVCLTQYDATFDLPVAFPPEDYPKILGEILSEAGLHQLRIAETEKYAHVTFFFNGGNEEPFPGEERVMVPSPQDVATYDEKPQMSAPEVTDEVVKCVDSGKYDVIILNYANGDMVGHTGFMDAAVSAMETVDECVGRVVDSVLGAGGSLLITADHGNCETMLDPDGEPQTAHTGNPVPLILVDPARKAVSLRSGILADIAPTMLKLLDIPVPKEMTGKPLMQE